MNVECENGVTRIFPLPLRERVRVRGTMRSIDFIFPRLRRYPSSRPSPARGEGEGWHGMPKLFISFLLFLLFTTTPAVADDTQTVSPFTSGQQHYDQNEYSLALADWQKAAGQGDTLAMDKLADMYVNGTGVPVDYAKALQYWHQAADKGDSDAMYEIAKSYETARSVAKDKDQMEAWLGKALAQCNLHAAGRLLERPSKADEALACFRKNAQAGDYKAMLDLAGKNHDGDNILNSLEGASWGHMAVETMQKKADAGDAQAMYLLGRVYFSGGWDAIPKDSKRGLDWYEKAASLGDIDAMDRLVKIYGKENGYLDYNKMNVWNKKLLALYTARAEKGDVNSMLGLIDEYYKPPNGSVDVNKAIAWAEKAAALGSRGALYQLGFMYEGTGSDNDNLLHDCKKARDYYEKAAALGEQNARNRLATDTKGAVGYGCNF
jgi:TPR repeat protein